MLDITIVIALCIIGIAGLVFSMRLLIQTSEAEKVWRTPIHDFTNTTEPYGPFEPFEQVIRQIPHTKGVTICLYAIKLVRRDVVVTAELIERYYPLDVYAPCITAVTRSLLCNEWKGMSYGEEVTFFELLQEHEDLLPWEYQSVTNAQIDAATKDLWFYGKVLVINESTQKILMITQDRSQK